LKNLTIRFGINFDTLNIKLSGDLSTDDIPILIKNIEQNLKNKMNKVIINIVELNTLSNEEINILEELKKYFDSKNIKIKLSAGDSKSLRSNLLINSPLKENVLIY